MVDGCGVGADDAESVRDSPTDQRLRRCAKHGPRGSELAHESCNSAAEDLAAVPHLREQARSHECMSAAADCMADTAPVGVSSLTRAAFQTLKIWWMYRPLRKQARSHGCISCRRLHGGHSPCGSELAHEGCISAAEDLAAVPAYSRASSLPQFDLQPAQLVSVWSIQELPAEAGSYQAEVFRFYRFDVGKVSCVGIRYAVRNSQHLAHLGFQVTDQCPL
jgi:hypothetical protein